MYLVMSGKVETFLVDEDNERILLDEAEPGHLFGEMSLLDGEPRSASAVAVTPSRLFIIDRDDLRRLIAKKPDAALDIMAVLGGRIRKTDVLLRTRVTKNANITIDEKMSLGDRVADMVAKFGGSWSFIGLFAFVIIAWIILNMFLLTHPFDPAPFIGLNLILSMLAALQAPVIMMSQNRQDAKDRVRSELDYQVNLKAEVEVMQLHEKVELLQREMLEQMAAIHQHIAAQASASTPANGSK